MAENKTGMQILRENLLKEVPDDLYPSWCKYLSSQGREPDTATGEDVAQFLKDRDGDMERNREWLLMLAKENEHPEQCFDDALSDSEVARAHRETLVEIVKGIPTLSDTVHTLMASMSVSAMLERAQACLKPISEGQSTYLRRMVDSITRHSQGNLLPILEMFRPLSEEFVDAMPTLTVLNLIGRQASEKLVTSPDAPLAIHKLVQLGLTGDWRHLDAGDGWVLLVLEHADHDPDMFIAHKRHPVDNRSQRSQAESDLLVIHIQPDGSLGKFTLVGQWSKDLPDNLHRHTFGMAFKVSWSSRGQLPHHLNEQDAVVLARKDGIVGLRSAVPFPEIVEFGDESRIVVSAYYLTVAGKQQEMILSTEFEKEGLMYAAKVAKTMCRKDPTTTMLLRNTLNRNEHDGSSS